MKVRFAWIVIILPVLGLTVSPRAQEEPAPVEKPAEFAKVLEEYKGTGKRLESQFNRYRRASWARHRLTFLVEDAARKLRALAQGDEPEPREVPPFPEPQISPRLKNLLDLDPEAASGNSAWITQLLGRPCPDPPRPKDRADFLERLQEPLVEGIETYRQLEAAQKKEIETLLDHLRDVEREIAALAQAPPAPQPPAAGQPARPADPDDEEYQERLMQEELQRRAQEQARKRAEQGGPKTGQKPETPRPVQPKPHTPRPGTSAPVRPAPVPAPATPVRPGPTPAPAPPRR